MRDRDLRVETALITEASGDDCHGAFRLANRTAKYGGYSLDLRVRATNTQWDWKPSAVVLADSGERILLVPSLPLEIHTTPLNPSSKGSVRIEGDMTLRSFAADLATFLVRAALELSPPGTSCVVPEEQLLFTTVRLSTIVIASAELALDGDFVGARDELQQVLPELYEQAGDAMIDIGLDCVGEALKEVAKKPVLIAKIGIAYLTWVPVAIFGYLRSAGRPAEVMLDYLP